MGIGALIGGGLSAGASLGGALLQSGAAQQAAGLQSQLGWASMANQLAMWQAVQKYLGPYAKAGRNVLPTLQSLITPSTSWQTLQNLPGFKFQSQWGTMAAENALAAQGLGGSAGPMAKAISDYNVGLAGTYWGQDVGALQNFANMGVGAGSALAGAAQGFSGQMANTFGQIGNAGAAGILGSANALAGGLSGAGNALFMGGLLGGFGGSPGFAANSPASNPGLYGNSSNFLSSLFGGIPGAPPA